MNSFCIVTLMTLNKLTKVCDFLVELLIQIKCERAIEATQRETVLKEAPHPGVSDTY